MSDLVAEQKTCTKCLETKGLSEFHKKKSGKFGVAAQCATCCCNQYKGYFLQNKAQMLAQQKDYRLQNKIQISRRSKKYYSQNKQLILEKDKKYRTKNKTRISERKRNSYLRNRTRVLEKAKEYNLNNKEKRKEYRIKNLSKRLGNLRRRHKEDPAYRILMNLRSRIRKVLNGESKSGRSIELIGCPTDFLKAYLESKWKEGMSWENYGVFGWHIDHIKPCSSFDMLDPAQQKACFHYTNLQPLWAHENLAKGDTII